MLARAQANPEVLAADRQAFQGGLAGAAPDASLAELQAQLQKAEQGNTSEAFLTVAGLAGACYVPLLRNGRVEDARALHQQLLAAVKKSTDVKVQAAAVAQEARWQAAVEKELVDPLVWSIKRALVRKDAAAAQQHLTVLLAVAPNDPRVGLLKQQVPAAP
jgi:hypothetical protein